MLPLNMPQLPTSAGLIGSNDFGLTRTDNRMRPKAETLLPAVNVGDERELARAYNSDASKIQIYHPSQAPSGISTENALLAKALMSPVFAHSSAATKMARLSNMFQDAPRFGSAVDLLC